VPTAVTFPEAVEVFFTSRVLLVWTLPAAPETVISASTSR
jgi:hypothetical protein